MADKYKLAYLAGLWDGEGSITVWKWQRKDDGTERLVGSMVFTNTDKKLIDFVESTLGEYGLKFSLHILHRTQTVRNWKVSYQLTSNKLQTVNTLSKLLLPYLVGKKQQAELLIEFTNSRLHELEKAHGHPSNTTKYLKREYEIEARMRELNRKGRDKSSETKRQT